MSEKRMLFIVSFIILCFAPSISAAPIDLISTARQAQWFNDRGVSLPFRGSDKNSQGFVRILSIPLEDGQFYSNVLETHPRWASYGWIEGRFQLVMPDNASFEATVGFVQGATGSDGVVFEVLWREGSQENLLHQVEKTYSRSLSSFSLNLSNYGGHSGMLILRVKAGASSGQDWAVWQKATILPLQSQVAPSPKITKAPLQVTGQQIKPKRPHPVVSAIPTASYDDPNEPDIAESKDFERIKFLCPKEEDAIGVEVNFYGAPNLNEFFFYFSTDGDEQAEILIRCLPTKFDVAKETSPGNYTNVVFSGRATITRNSYSIKLPWSQIFGDLDKVVIWLYAMDGQDRVPDKGQLQFTHSQCSLERYRPHPVVQAIPKVPKGDNDKDGLDDGYEYTLLYKFRPYFLFSKDLVEGRSTEEHYNPTDALWYIQQSELLAGGAENSPTILDNNTLTANPSRILSVSSPHGSTDITKNPAKPNYHINPLAEAHGVSHDPGRHGQPWSDILQQKNIGLYGHVVRANRNYQRGNIQCEADNYDFIKIEYWQFFGYNNANAPEDAGDHEGDWGTVQLLYDPAQDRIVKVFHYAHGSEIQFEMATETDIKIVNTSWGSYKEYRGPNYGKTFNEAGATAQNNAVRFYLDPQSHEYTHPVVYIEYGSHEFWPTELGSYTGWWVFDAPPHKGDDINHRYLTEAPLNLGEVEAETMVNDTAEIILKYNGFWGTYNKKNYPPAGPPLHTEWTWPAHSRIRPLITNYLEN